MLKTIRNKCKNGKDVPTAEIEAAMTEIDNGGGIECVSLKDMYKSCGIKRNKATDRKQK